jgi:hypothetical protein
MLTPLMYNNNRPAAAVISLHFRGTGDGWVEVVVFDLKAVQLEDQRTIRDQSLIFRATVRALTAEEALVPLATRFDIGHRDEGLGAHQILRRDSGSCSTDFRKTRAGDH